jgi:hypothetical protein
LRSRHGRIAAPFVDILPRGGKAMRTGWTVTVRIGDAISVVGLDLELLVREVRDFVVKNVENEASTAR